MGSCETLGVVPESAVRRCATPLQDHRTAAVAGRAMVKTAIKKDNPAAVSADPELGGSLVAAPRRAPDGWMDGCCAAVVRQRLRSPRRPPCVARV